MLADMNDDLVPGLADAVEKRRKQLGLSPGEFATAASLTRQGLAPVRKGHRREYQDKLKIGVARALRWPMDWYEMIEAGGDPDTWPEPTTVDGKLYYESHQSKGHFTPSEVVDLLLEQTEGLSRAAAEAVVQEALADYESSPPPA